MEGEHTKLLTLCYNLQQDERVHCTVRVEHKSTEFYNFCTVPGTIIFLRGTVSK